VKIIVKILKFVEVLIKKKRRFGYKNCKVRLKYFIK